MKRAPGREDPAPLRDYARGLLDAVTLHALALQLAGAADGGGFLARALLARLLVVAAQLHLAIDAFPLQLLLERAQGLLDVVIANHDLHKLKPPRNFERQSPRDRRGVHLVLVQTLNAPNPLADRPEPARP